MNPRGERDEKENQPEKWSMGIPCISMGAKSEILNNGKLKFFLIHLKLKFLLQNNYVN